MGIFVNALCEETEFLDNTGFDSDAVANPDDKYQVELNDVAKAVEDINQNYADQSSQEELDGQDLAEDPVSECMIAIYESEHNWNQIMNTLASREVLEAARGREMVMESVDIKGFFAKVKEFFVKMWRKITAVVKQWLGNASAVLKTNKGFIKKYGKDLENGKKAYEADTSKKAFKGYSFEAAVNAGTVIGYLTNANKKADIAVDKAKELINSIKSESFDKDVANSLNGRMANYVNPSKIRASLLGDENGSADGEDFTKKLKEKWFGSVEKVTLPSTAKSLSTSFITDILSGDMKIGDVKKAYDSAKKSFNKILKALDDMEKAINSKKGEPTAADSQALTACSQWSTKVKECRNVAQTGLTMYMKLAVAMASQARRVGNAYIFALNKSTRKDRFDKADKGIGESAGFFSSLDLI